MNQQLEELNDQIKIFETKIEHQQKFKQGLLSSQKKNKTKKREQTSQSRKSARSLLSNESETRYSLNKLKYSTVCTQNKQSQQKQENHSGTLQFDSQLTNKQLIGSSLTQQENQQLQVIDLQIPERDTNSSKYFKNSQKQLLNYKIKEVSLYKAKCSKFQQTIKKLKSDLQSKDQLLNNQQKLSKEYKILKDQYKTSEEVREQQKAEILKLQNQLLIQQKENIKLKKTIRKTEKKQKESQKPIKVVFEENK